MRSERRLVVIVVATPLVASAFAACGGFEGVESTPEPSTKEAGATGLDASVAADVGAQVPDAGRACELVPLGLPSLAPAPAGGVLQLEGSKVVAQVPLAPGVGAQAEWPELDAGGVSSARLRFWRRIAQEPEAGGEVAAGCTLSCALRDAGRSVLRVVVDDRIERLDARWFPPDGGNVRWAPEVLIGALRNKPMTIDLEASFPPGQFSASGARSLVEPDAGPPDFFAASADPPFAVAGLRVRCGVSVTRAVDAGSARVEIQDVVLELCREP